MKAVKAYKTSFNLTEDALDTLKRLAEKRGSTIAEALRQSIADAGFIRDTIDKGGKVLIDDGTGPVKQLVLR